MRRIGLAVVLAVSLTLAPLVAEAQQTGKVYRLGFLRWQEGPDANFEALQQNLRELGWIEGRNVAFEYRWAAGQLDRLPLLAEELVHSKVDLIVTNTMPVARRPPRSLAVRLEPDRPRVSIRRICGSGVAVVVLR
jgi:ABC-type uncharacterized transport system substrate-binding protein